MKRLIQKLLGPDPNRALEDENRRLKNQVEYLVRTIRDMDQKIFTISQCAPDWKRMRPFFAELNDEVTARKVEESKRINALLVPELHKAYLPPKE